MVSSDFRTEARRKLEGKWGKAACITLAYMFIFFVIGFITGLFPDSAQGFLSIVTTIIDVPLGLGYIFSMIQLFNGEETKAFDFFTIGFNNFGKSWSITFQIIAKMIVPIILIIVSYILVAFGSVGTIGGAFISASASTGYLILAIIGVILLVVSMIWAITKSYYYQLAYILAAENPEMSAQDLVIRSQELMEGNRAKLFYLQLTFIGWAILGLCTLGIGYLWLIPYIQFATIAFYKFLNGDNSNVEVEVEAKVVTEDNDNSIQGE